MEYYPQGYGRMHLPPAPTDLRQLDDTVFSLVQDLQKGYSGVCEKGDERENALLERTREVAALGFLVIY